MDMKLFSKIEDWHKDRNLTDSNAQMVKVLEEVGELAKAIAHGSTNCAELEGAIGDSLIALIGVAATLDLDSSRCLDQAWAEVKHRTGKTVGGHFIKEGDH